MNRKKSTSGEKPSGWAGKGRPNVLPDVNTEALAVI